MKSIALHRMGKNMGKESYARGLDQRDISVSHVRKEIKKCLCNKIITA